MVDQQKVNPQYLNILKMVKTQEKKTKRKVSIGEIFGSQIFEQVGDKYAVYEEMANGTWDLTTKRTNEQFMPMHKTPLTHPTKALEYESLEQLWKDVKNYVHKHLDISNPLGYDVFVAFIFSTWVSELFDFTCYLGFYGREAVGKTRALELLKELCFRAWLTTGITVATLFRLIERFNPTLLLDESEFLTTQERKELIGLINAGQRRGIMIPRMKGEHADEAEFFSVYSAKAIAGTEQLKRTTTSRMITFTMTKNIRSVPRRVDKKEGLRLRNQLLMWRFRTIAQLKGSLNFKVRVAPDFELKATAEFEELDCLSGRSFELFYPLYYVAPKARRQNILTFATELEQMKLRAEKTELSSMVFEAIINLKDTAQHGLLLIKDIAQYVNADQPSEYQIMNQRIGTKCSQMGFEKVRTNKGTAILLNSTILDRLRADPRYTTDLMNYVSADSEDSEAKKGCERDWLSSSEEV